MIVKKIMDACNRIVNVSTKELYAISVMHFRKVCEKYPDLLKYAESTILDLVMMVSRKTVNRIFLS